MIMWQDYFKVKGIRPGRVVTFRHGTLDFSNPKLPLQTIFELYEEDFPYLVITAKGKEKFYGIKPAKPKAKPKFKPTVEKLSSTKAIQSKS